MRATPSFGQLLGARLCGGAPVGGDLAEREVAGSDALGDFLGVLAGLVHEVDERSHDAGG